MYCSRCGAQLAPRAAFCGACGSPAGAVVGAEPPLERPAVVTVLAVLQFLGAAIWLLAAIMTAAAAAMDAEQAGVAAGIAIVVAGAGALQLSCGLGLWRLRPHGRTLQLVFAWIGLLAFPIGTIISILILVYMFKPGIKALFSGRPVTELTPEELAQITSVSQGSRVAVIVAIIAVAVIGIAVMLVVAQIALPGLARARVTANETSTIASLRSITTAQAAFSASCGNGFYSPSLARLGVSPPTPRQAGNGFIAADLAADPVTRSGYTIVLTAGPAVRTAPASCNGAPAGTLVETFFVGAAPVGDGPGRFFGMNQDGTIYQSDTPVPITLTGSPAGSVPAVQ